MSHELLMGHPGPGNPETGLGSINASLYLETANEGRSSKSDFNNQTEQGYVVPAAMLGMRQVISARTLEHGIDQQIAYDKMHMRLLGVTNRTGLKLHVPEPAWVVIDDEYRFDAESTWQLHRHRPRRAVSLLNSLPDLMVNQRSQLVLDIVEQVAASRGKTIDTGRGRLHALLTAELNNKQNYVELMRGMNGSIPPHVPTELIRLHDIPHSFDTLLNQLQLPEQWNPDAGIVLKSATDAGSEVLVFVRPERYQEAIASLVAQNQEKLAYGRQEDNITLLAQPIIQTPRGIDLKSFGIALQLGPDGAEVNSATSQLYDGVHYTGSYFSVAEHNAIVRSMDEKKLTAFGDFIHAETGYTGIAVFDGMNDTRFGPHMIFDGNYRQSATLYAKAVRSFLLRQQIPVSTIANVGYTGKYHAFDQDRLLTSLALDNLLFTTSNPQGILPLPNMNSSGGYDLIFINMEKEAILAGWEQAADYADHNEISELRF